MHPITDQAQIWLMGTHSVPFLAKS